jgi:release factor glutamine methyltransferase
MKPTVTGAVLAPWYQTARHQARTHNIPLREVDWLLQGVSDISLVALRLGDFPPVITLDRPWGAVEQLWQKRCQERQPLQYLVGATPWRNFDLLVSPAVLIPRPETELIIDLILERLPTGADQGPWLDLGTGSGAIAIGLATALPGAQVHAVDRSIEALTIAQANADRCGVAERITFYGGDWAAPLEFLSGLVQGLVANPPYIPSALVDALAPEVVDWEPRLALDGGRDGLDAIRILVAQGVTLLRPGGMWAIETMAGQGAAVVELLAQTGAYGDMEVLPDWAGLDRFVIARRR